ncbi:MAG: type II toxin-antitoxin system RelE/ParE family toxin [Planctomycetes bacterium]|nr:type II toxin-antitoxin system RelE/ParE family toxin [Planctomycetota bacterium]
MVDPRYAVSWTEEALRDLDENLAYVSVDSLEAAERVLASLERRALSLERSPERGRVVPELAQLGVRASRETVVAPYRIVYRTHERTVMVLAIVDGRRDLEDILFDRLIRRDDKV